MEIEIIECRGSFLMTRIYTDDDGSTVREMVEDHDEMTHIASLLGMEQGVGAGITPGIYFYFI